MLFTVIVYYVMIALNVYVNRRVHPYSSGAVSSERKRTVTLLLVIVLSSLAFLPWFFDVVLRVSKRLRGLSAEAGSDMRHAVAQFLPLRQFLCKPLSLYLKNEGV